MSCNACQRATMFCKACVTLRELLPPPPNSILKTIEKQSAAITCMFGANLGHKNRYICTHGNVRVVHCCDRHIVWSDLFLVKNNDMYNTVYSLKMAIFLVNLFGVNSLK